MADPLYINAVSADALASDGPARDRAVLRLRALLVTVASFELERRRPQLSSLSTAEAARLVRDAADAACVTLLRRLDTYHGQSRFHVWAAKFAIHETALAARRRAARTRVRAWPLSTQTS